MLGETAETHLSMGCAYSHCRRPTKATNVDTGPSKNAVSQPARRESSRPIGGLRRASLNTAAGSAKNVRIVEHTKLDFDKLMNNRDGVEAMAAFAASEYADENVRFWIAVQDYKELEASGSGSEACSAEMCQAAAAIIDKFLCASAEQLINLPSQMLASYSKPSLSGAYEFSPGMFDEAHAEIRKLIHNDTFSRFKLSDEAESLLWDVPMLGMSEEAFSAAFNAEKAQAALRPLILLAQELTGADRVTAWLVDGDVMWSIASTKLGNAIIQIPYGAGLAGSAAKNGTDLIIADAYNDPTFNKEIDKVTGYRTRSVLCVPLKRPQRANADGTAGENLTDNDAKRTMIVLQLLNKISENKKNVAFTAEDAVSVRESLELPLIDACDLIALSAGKRKSFIDQLDAIPDDRPLLA